MSFFTPRTVACKRCAELVDLSEERLKDLFPVFPVRHRPVRVKAALSSLTVVPSAECTLGYGEFRIREYAVNVVGRSAIRTCVGDDLLFGFGPCAIPAETSSGCGGIPSVSVPGQERS